MTGWRVGYACAAPALVEAMVTLQSQDTTHPTLFAQHGAVAALEGPPDALAAMTAEYAARRDLILAELATVPGFRCAPPEGAFYLFPDVREALAVTGCGDDNELALRLLQEAGVAVVAGSAFAGAGHVRLSYAVSRDEIRAGAERIRRWLQEARR
jgi:aspartate aminotransferase